VYKPLVAPLLIHRKTEHGAEGAANILRATFSPTAAALLRLLGSTATSSRLKREDQDVMANPALWPPSPSPSPRETAAPGVILRAG
jgi:hypothetical protein